MHNPKIVSINRLVKTTSRLKKQGAKIVFTNGCFDIIHAGHIAYLTKAKQLGDILIVAVNSDSSVKTIKAKNRPVNTLKDRLKIIAALECVDYACSFSQQTPLNLIKKLIPNVLVKGADWKKEDVVGSDVVNKHGGKVVTVKFEKGRSTSSLIKKIISLHK